MFNVDHLTEPISTIIYTEHQACNMIYIKCCIATIHVIVGDSTLIYEVKNILCGPSLDYKLRSLDIGLNKQ